MGKLPELSELDIMRLRGCLLNEAMRHRELMQENAKDGWLGIAFSEKAEAHAIIALREKFQFKKSEGVLK